MKGDTKYLLSPVKFSAVSDESLLECSATINLKYTNFQASFHSTSIQTLPFHLAPNILNNPWHIEDKALIPLSLSFAADPINPGIHRLPATLAFMRYCKVDS